VACVDISDGRTVRDSVWSKGQGHKVRSVKISFLPAVRGVDPGGGVLTLKIYRRVRVWPPPPPKKNVTSFHSKLSLDNSAIFTSSRIIILCQIWKVKLIFRGAWNSLTVWPDWPWPPYFTTNLRYCLPDFISMSLSHQILAYVYDIYLDIYLGHVLGVKWHWG